MCLWLALSSLDDCPTVDPLNGLCRRETAAEAVYRNHLVPRSDFGLLNGCSDSGCERTLNRFGGFAGTHRYAAHRVGPVVFVEYRTDPGAVGRAFEARFWARLLPHRPSTVSKSALTPPRWVQV